MGLKCSFNRKPNRGSHNGNRGIDCNHSGSDYLDSEAVGDQYGFQIRGY